MTGANAQPPTAGVGTCYADNVFPRQIIDYLNDYAESMARTAEVGTIVRSDASIALDQHVRRSKVCWMERSPQSAPIYDFIWQFVQHANRTVFNYDLRGFEEPLQLATYTAEDQGFYGWHVDTGGGRLANRKLSIVIPLTDPRQYGGGGFEVFQEHEPTQFEMPLGRMLAFPSYLLHRVKPLTHGVRRSLAVWIAGPPFR